NSGYGSFRKKMAELKVPTSLIWGRGDRILGIKDTEAIAATIPRCRLEWIDQCGHVPHLEKPQLTASLIHQAIAGHPHDLAPK
ncbi:MAG: alpha/beta hydrolase, partial [Cyanobacteria bacterium P01_F01_bin.153]